MTGRRIRVRGQVQGVGFRPFIWQLANRLGITGEVLNDAEGVLIFADGAELSAFETAISAEAPPLARVDAVESAPADVSARPDFTIAASGPAGAETRVTPDAATCTDCSTEIADPDERRHGYPFTNCTNCGPRFTLLRSLPYDRAHTTMAPFEMCAACRAEYENPADRRFHAQPIACPECGPQAWLEIDGQRQPPEKVGEVLSGGGIVAIKGLGGFHLCCDARNANAIATLRERKRRPAKPLALMAGLDVIVEHAAISEDEWALLSDIAAPIVLLDKAGAPLPDALAPGQRRLGWMLPYTPLHHLLLTSWARGPLVMTSGNLSGEPQVIGNDEAREKLAGFADAFLMHDRDIARRLDDSVEQVTPHGRMILRRARGRVPETLPLPDGFGDAPQVVAYGGQMKSAICLIKKGQALLSHHLGDLDDALTVEEFEKADSDYRALFDHKPEIATCDLHPDFRATRHARAQGLPVEAVQHHHAHLAACLAENGWPLDGGKVAGIILDGLGLGTDGTVWGGEILLGDYHGFERRAWLKPAPLIGGDKAQMEPWRNALVRLDQAGLSDWADELFPNAPREIARKAVAQGINAPLSSSAGRLFDAVAACLGICPMSQSFEGEAAMRLETFGPTSNGFVPFEMGGQNGEIDPAPLFQALHETVKIGQLPADMSAGFHSGIARVFAIKARDLVQSGEAKAVALSGGCFQNARLLALTLHYLGDTARFIHTKTPANDGGLALGQAVIAAARAVRT